MYDSAGVWIGTDIDEDEEGSIDAIAQIQYDESGNLVRRLVDQDLDNVFDNAYVYTKGELGEDAQLDADVGNDGSIDSVATFKYEIGSCILSQFGPAWGTVCL